eukprot:gene3834-biopygen1945
MSRLPHGIAALQCISESIINSSRDVIFSERDFHDFDTTASSKSDHTCIEFDDEINPEVDGNVIEEVNHEVNHNMLPVGATYEENFMREIAKLQCARTRSSAKLAEQVNEENENCLSADIIADEIDEPRKIQDAGTGEHASEWKEVTDAEYSSLIKNKTWDLVPIPKGKNIVGSKWVFKVKRNADGSVDRSKSRLVAQGYSQAEWIDYQEVKQKNLLPKAGGTVLECCN